MKCQGTLDDGTPCDFVFKEKDKFCSQCGQKRIESPATVPCSCGKPLTWGEKFCSECGLKVDPALFGKQNKTCGKPQADGSLCSNALSPGEEICRQCHIFNPTPGTANPVNTPVKKEIIPLLTPRADGGRQINTGTAAPPARTTASDTYGSADATTVCSRQSQPPSHDSQSQEKLTPADDTENSATQVQKIGTPGAQMAASDTGGSSNATTVCSRPSKPPSHDSQSQEILPPADDTENSATQVQKTGTPNAQMAASDTGGSSNATTVSSRPSKPPSHYSQSQGKLTPADDTENSATQVQKTGTPNAQMAASDTGGSSNATTVCSRPSKPPSHDSQSQGKLTPADDTENSATQVQKTGTPSAQMAGIPPGASSASAGQETHGSHGGSATGGEDPVAPARPCQNPPGVSNAAAEKSALLDPQAESLASATDSSGTHDTGTMTDSKRRVPPGKENTSGKTSVSGKQGSEGSKDESSMEPVRKGKEDSNGKSVQETGSSVDFDPSQGTIQNDSKAQSKETEFVFGGGKKTPLKIASEKRESTPSSGSSAQCETNDDKKQNTEERGLAQGTAPGGNHQTAQGAESESADRRHLEHDATPYLKQKDQPEDLSQGKKKKKKKMQNQDPHDPLVDVVFHVLISEDFELSDRKRPCLVIGDLGWDERKEMEIVRKFGSHTEVRTTVSMRKSLRNKGFDYKYGLLKLKEKASENKFSHEFVYTRKSPGEDNPNRKFLIPDGHKLSHDVWHQYDGLAYPELNKGLFKKVAGYFFETITTKIRDDVLLAAECFMPPMNQLEPLTSLDDVPLKAEKILRDVDEVMTTLRFQMVDNRRERPDPELMTKAITANVLKPLVKMMIQLATGKGTTGHQAEKRTSGVVLGVLCILVVDKYQIRLTPQTTTIVFRALALQVHEQQTCPELEAVQRHFPIYSANLHTILLEFVKTFMSTSTREADVIWLHCIPLIHFLRGDSKPYSEPDPNLNHDTKAFWGVVDLQHAVDKVKDRNSYGGLWIPAVEKMLEEVKPSFQVDRLMPRTFVALLNIPQLPTVMNTSIFRPDVCAAVLTYYWRKTVPRSEFQTMADCHTQLKKELTTWLSNSCKDSDTSPDPATSSYLLRIARTLQDLLEEVTFQTVRSHFFVHTTFSMLIMCLDAMAKLELKLNPGKEPAATQHFNVQVSKVIAWLRRTFFVDRGYKGDFLNHMKVWNAFVKIFELSELLGKWENEFTSAFQHDALQMSPERCFENLGEENISDFSDAMQAKVQHVLFAAFEKMAVNDRYNTRWSASKRTGDMMSRLLQQNWPKDQNLLQFILTWPPIKLCLEKFYGHEAATHLTEECQCRLMEILARIDGAVESLRTGKINLTDLELMKNKRKSLKSVLHASAKSKGENADERMKQWMRLLEAREEEVNAFIQYRDGLATLANFCSHLQKADSRSLMANLRRLQEVKDCCLDKLCTPREEEVILTQRSEPVVNPLGLPDEVLAILPALHKWQASSLFMSMWRDAAVQCQDKDVNTAIQSVWKTVSTRWNNLCMQVQMGSISFADMNRHLRVFEGNEQSIRKELEMMTDDRNAGWIQERITQLDRYQSIQNCVEGAQVILDFKTGLGITDEFQPVQRILEMGSKKKVMMNQLSDAVWNICKVLGNITTEQVKCLKELENSKELMQWLKESLPDGLKELKVFVDLAFISAGEGDMEIDKVNCFHAAVTGYAPLIFDLDEKVNFTTFLDRCRQVWRELDADRNLPEKLVSTRRYLPWLKMVRQSHGSVEVTALTQAKTINERGIYRVGNITKSSDLPGLDLEAVIDLRVRPDDKQVMDARVYSHKQLIDLQSRLMLVAGQAEKGKDNVEKFTMVLDAIIRLGRVYISLCTDGCVLFNCWRAKFLCEVERSLCTVVEFGTGDNREALKAQRGHEHLEVFIMALAGCLEEFHEKWTEYVRSKREVYQELNHFTVQQLVLLQQELIRVGPDSPPRPQVLALLSLVLPDCSQQQLYTAMQQAQEQILMGEAGPRGEESEDPGHEEEAEERSEEAFVQHLMESGFSRKMALAALEQVGADDLDGGLVWCMEQDQEEEEEMKQETASSPNPSQGPSSYQGWQATGESVSASAAAWIKSLSSENRENVSVERLKASMRDIWTKFLEAVSSSVADYLSLEHLAIILQRLACMSTEEICRSLPPMLKKNTPNLIVCPQVDVLKTVIHMYMHSPDQPLPRPDEVLLCNFNTTIDQVDGFLRRAFFASQGKLHCLVDADLLDYEVGEKTEKKLKEYVGKTGDDYNLLVVCSGENEYRARIVAALDRHRCHPPVVSNTAIRAYLRKKFSSTSTRHGVQSASHVDCDGSTVRVVKSKRAGVGKTLYKRRLVEQLQDLNGSTEQRGHPLSVSVPLYERRVCTNSIAQTLLKHTCLPEEDVARIFHFDISYDVQDGVDAFLFNLLVLGCITSDAGLVWLRSPMDLYVIETIPLVDTTHKPVRGVQHLMHNMLEVLPEVQCWSPQESLHILEKSDIPQEYQENDQLFDEQEFRSKVYQRPYQYLKRFDENKSLSDVDASKAEGDLADGLKVLLRHCGIPDPSWAELRHFIWFLNTQLADFEMSSFCGAAAAEDLPGFAKFLLRFLFQMSRDFATRSLRMAEESPLAARAAVQEERGDGEDAALELFKMRRTWESSPHPYIFFNPDGHSMTFLGFNIDRGTGNLVDHQTGAVLENAIMDKALQESLHRNRVPLYENFDALDRVSRIAKLASVIGLDYAFDPDETYELTTDNVKKMMAIYMRFRCGIPVIIMGETGCGKTRLVKFLCQLQAPPGVEVNNMVLMKVHGGTTAADITRKVQAAEELARQNAEEFGAHMYTVLFFDEANSTEAIGLIKEILCDGSMGGQPLALSNNLKMVAACNPYRKHSEELIKRLEKAGLGYHVDADQTVDRLGRVPMRRLVYRVQPLPQSMLPLVWDFGQLRTDMEEKYIRQMVGRYVRKGQLPNRGGLVEILSRILIEAQEFMRKRNDECSFVSLRDVERTLQVMSWFYSKAEEDRALFNIIDPTEVEEADHEDEEEDELEDEYPTNNLPDDLTKSAILALAVCYRACLQTREDFDEAIAAKFQPPLPLSQGVDDFRLIIEGALEAFMDNVMLEENIAKNHALSENVFMMVVCTELRIPLFLVGKPGSSKSLAKTIVADAMQGNSAHFPLFRNLKQTHMVSFQCSPLSTADGIVGTFRQCAQFQKDKNLHTFVSVVVLDEVGLAEDSPKMPLKTLHPLLEDGCQGDENPEPYKKVAFIGISNWALDPAKMNRGILVQREVPDAEELVNSAEGICASNPRVKQIIEPLVRHLATGYLKIFETAQTKREFFGLRDYYSLVKMICGFAAKSERVTCWHQLEHSIRRNFGGLDHINPVDIFSKELPTILHHEQKCHEDDPDCDASRLIEAGLFGDDLQSESRYLLLLTENYGALNILQQQVFASHDAAERTGQRRHVVPQTIFGSSFPKDQEYTQICRNINKIKVCMETGHTVILLNLENLYESLYDALNQYYAKLGGEKYVDLGLGTHRVKCRVHRDFRLIVVAEKQVVYDKFPIPLINRLEKHFLTLSNLMSPLQLQVADQLHQWATKFATPRQPPPLHQRQRQEPKPGDVFMGYHPDATAALVLQHWDSSVDQDHPDHRLLEEISKRCRNALLDCATPDAVVRLKDSQLYLDEQELTCTYFLEQQHDSLLHYLDHCILENRKDHFFAQVTTHSKLLTDGERLEMAEHLGLEPQSAVLLTLQSFDTEQQFSQQIRSFVGQPGASGKLLLVQCNSGHNQMDLLKCAQYSVVDALPSSLQDFYVIFIVQLPRIAGDCFSGFQAGKWHSLHIDDLRQPGKAVPSFLALRHLSPSALLQSAMPGQRLSPHRVESQSGPAEDDLSATANEREDVPMETEEDLGLDDIVIEERDLFGEGEVPKEREFPEEREIPGHPAQLQDEKPGGRGCFDPESFRQLILSCLQAAVAMVQDADPESQRPMERIDLLLSLISADSPQCEPSFVFGLCGLITKLLKEKEDTIVGQDGARDWLAAEAARVDRVKEAGTFRRAWVQCLETKVTPILGGIVAFLDTHHNLDLVVKGQPWQRDLWLAVLLSPETCDLHYASLTSPEKRREATKMAPHTTTAHGATFAVQLPFSWLLLQPLDALLSQNSNIDERLETVVSSVQNMPFCRLLMSVAEGNEKDIIKAYVHDFIRSKYKLQSEGGYNLLCETLVAACHQMGEQILAMPLPRTLVALHWVHREAEARLHSFLSIERVWPQVTEALLTRNTPIWDQGDQPLSRLDSTDELTLDVAGLYLLLNELEPHKDQLNTARGRQQWLTKVTKFSPTLTTILNTLEWAMPECGPRCLIFIDKARCLWTRVLAMKLFVDHFFPAKAETALEVRCMPLWGFLGPEANLKTEVSLKKVETFLKTANKEVLKKTLGGKVPNCPACHTDSEAPLLKLPCKHQICVKCFQDMKAEQELACPECDRPIPEDFDEGTSGKAQGEHLEKFEEYQRRCNSFLMALVAKLCFAGDSVPEPAAVERILGYVMRKSRSGEMLQTKQLTLFDNLVDPSPVVRSFLLQLLIRKRGEDTKKHLEEFFRQAQRHCRRRGGAGDSNEDRDLREFALLVLHCLEDMHHENTPPILLEGMEFIVEQLWAAREDLLRKAFDLTKISALARCRHGLEVVAGLIHGVEVANNLPLNREEREVYQALLKATRALLDLETDWPRNFFLKQLCREFGVECYYTLVERRDFSWLKLEDTNEVKQCQDRFLVCGRDYQHLRDTMTTILLGEDVTTLEKALEAVEGEREVRERAALLALYRCVTMSFLHPDAPPDRTKVQAIQTLAEFLDKCPNITQKELAQGLLGNRLGGAGSPLVLAPGRSLGEQSLVAWLLHFRLLLSRGPRLLQPLSALALQPQNMQNTLLPTMPEDDARKVHDVLLATRTDAENPVLYRCPNGHPYIIGNCGNPATVGRCNECGAGIGGTGYVPAAQNVKDEGQDRTERGYILGPAAQRSVQAVPERSLTPGACSLLRLLTHAALLLGAGTNSQAVMELVKPQHRAGMMHVEAFFWDHLMKDLEVLTRCLGKSVDDIFSLLHCLVEAMWGQRNAGQQRGGLASKDERQQWETDIDRAFLTPAIQGADALITELNENIAQDKNMGQDRLLCLMYEVGSPPSHLPPDSLHLDPAVWRYRERITVAHFFQRLDLEQEAGASLEVLRLFRKECHILQALRHVPELLQFQRLLLSLYHRRLDRSEALKIPIRDLLARSRDQGVRLLESLDLFCRVWEAMKGYLLTYPCWTLQAGTVKLPEAERSMVLTPETPCAFFLPATRGPGLVAYILTEFLLRHHNRFMEEYCSITRRRYEDLAEVQLRNLTASHLVCLELERDLLPLVLANCNYSFQMGKGTQVEYDFHGFQRELVEQFLQSKARVHKQHHVIPIETMSYRDDTTAAIKLKALRDRLTQESLSPASRHQISSQLPGLPEICQCLSDLDVAISFLQSLGGEPGFALHSYMVDVLRMAPNTLCSQKARQVCQLKHVQSLWLLLCFERAKILAQYREEAFDSLGQELQAELKPEQKAALGEFCQDQRLSLEKLECLLQQLFDCILLRIAQSATPQEGEDEAFDLSGQKLRDVLMTDLEELLDDENPERLPVAMEDLSGFPEDITGSQASRAWLCIFHNIGVKKRQLF